MSVADFRNIDLEQGQLHGEALFRAAIAAFAELHQATWGEAAQLDDLAIAMVATMPRSALRFAAQTLSKIDPAPRRLVKWLAEQLPEISAPILEHSPILADADLVTLIARHGLLHARHIARRRSLHPAIAALIKALLSRAGEPAAPEPVSPPESRIADIRDQLRNLMEESAPPLPPTSSSPEDLYEDLRDAALTGEIRAYAKALSKGLGLSIAQARCLISGATYSDLLFALKSLDLVTERALLLTLSAYPAQVASPAAIRLFLVRYESLQPASAHRKIEEWRAEDDIAPATPQAPATGW